MDTKVKLLDWVVLVLVVAAFISADELTACFIGPALCIEVCRELNRSCVRERKRKEEIDLWICKEYLKR